MFKTFTFTRYVCFLLNVLTLHKTQHYIRYVSDLKREGRL